MGDTSGKTSIGACPACSQRLKGKLLVFGSEDHAFRCEGCGIRLMKFTRAFPILILGGIAALVAIYFVAGRTWINAALAGWITLLAFVGLRTTRVRLADNTEPDAPDTTIPEDPPPPDPTFRGMSGPPPKQGD